ncbi:MAG: undecaprenyl-phosphate galactose phosphotransferase WbaP [Nitrospirae bacterium]|nr:undecaprenyl-phosphate galactose phosphotransferase WbaP [Nitrospirota bacterium]
MRIDNGYKEVAGAGALALVDIVAFYLSLTIAYYFRILLDTIFTGIVPLQFDLAYFISFWWIPAVFLVCIAYEGLYARRIPFWDEAREIIKAVTVAVIVIFAVMSLGKFAHRISRLTIILLYFSSTVVFPVMRLIGKKMLFRMNLWKEKLIIIGAGETGKEVAEGIEKESHLGYSIVGFLDDDPNKIGRTITVNGKEFKVFGKVKNFNKFISLMNISTVIIAIPSSALASLAKLTESVQKNARRVLFVPDLKGIALANTELRHLSAQQMFMLKINNNLKSDFNRFVKKSFDLVFALSLLPFLLCMLVIFGIWIAFDSIGGVFLLQDRIGRNGKIFKCIKFRTMYSNADEILSDYLRNSEEAQVEWNRFKKLRDYDPRVTPVGKFLRKTSLDELPQIVNVLMGDMSFFGPRPYLPEEEKEIMGYTDLILVTCPGITGLWQVSGRNILDFEERVKLDAWYVLNWSLWLDIVILFKTIAVVAKKEGAY